MCILHKNDNNIGYQTKEVQKIKCMDMGVGSIQRVLHIGLKLIACT